MAKQAGRLMLVKIGDGEVSETFDNLCGLTTKTLTLNNASYDVTTADCTTPGGQLWTEVMTGARQVSVSGSGYFPDDASSARAIAVAMGTGVTDTDDAIANFQIVIPDFGIFQGAFHVDSMEWTGAQTDGETYSFSLSSSGTVTFTAS